MATQTIDRAARVIEARPGIMPADLAVALAMSPASIPDVVAELRQSGEALPRTVITVSPRCPVRRAPDPIQARILRRCRLGLVVIEHLPAELDESEADCLAAVRRLRFRHAVITPTGIWPARAHHNPIRWAAHVLAMDDR